eukprot:6197399-Pleurochrysis_carterae.AAC.2
MPPPHRWPPLMLCAMQCDTYCADEGCNKCVVHFWLGCVIVLSPYYLHPELRKYDGILLQTSKSLKITHVPGARA